MVYTSSIVADSVFYIINMVIEISNISKTIRAITVDIDVGLAAILKC
jgi:hypothetical protein